MLTSVCVSGRLGDLAGKNIRYVEVECPIIGSGGKRKIDLIPVLSPLGKSTCFFKAKKGAFVIVKGRLSANDEYGLCVHSEIEEIVDFKKEGEE